MLFDPAVAVIDPPQLLLITPEDATCKPFGSVLVNPSPVSGIILSFTIAKASTVVLFSGTVAAEKKLESTGGAGGITVKLADAATPEPTFEDTTEVTSFCWPGEIPCTCKERTQLLPEASTPSDSAMLEEPDVAVITPPHPALDALGVAITSPGGRLSVKAIAVIELLPELVIVKLKLVVCPNRIAEAPKAALIVGGTGVGKP